MPINKTVEGKSGKSSGFYAAVRRVHTQRSAASISDGCNILFGDQTNIRKSLLSRTTRVPVKGNITIPYGVFTNSGPGRAKCVADATCDDPMDARTLSVSNYGCRFPVCEDAFEDAPGLEDFYKTGLRSGLERNIDGNIIYTAEAGNAGLIGIIGASSLTDADAKKRGAMVINNAENDKVTLADLEILISAIDPYSYSTDDLVIVLSPTDWQGIRAEVYETFAVNRINLTDKTFDGYSVFLYPSLPKGQAGVAAIKNYLVGVRKDLELTTCGSCDTIIKAKARLAGAMAGIGGAYELNTGVNVPGEGAGLVLGQEGVYAAYLSGKASTP